MAGYTFEKSGKYTDYDTIYEQCSGPGGLELAEFMAWKMGLEKGRKMLDVGCNRGWQTCFLAKEYGLFIVGIDPWNDREKGNPMVEHLRDNAVKWGVEDLILGVNIGLPDTPFASESFDYVYSTTALEMVRVSLGNEGYLKCLKEIYRLLKPGGIFGLAEPMHLDREIPDDLMPYVSTGEYPWKDCFTSLKETLKPVKSAGFEIVEADYSSHSRDWWLTFAKHDPFCKKDPDGDPKILEIDKGRWVSFGYVISRKPDK